MRPRLLYWFQNYNKDKPYSEQVRPFGFLNAYQTKSAAQRQAGDLLYDSDEQREAKHKQPLPSELPRAVSPFDPDPATAVKACFDRDSSEAVAPELLRTYQQAVARYHLHPEEKFRGGDYTQAGLLDRRHVRVPDVNGIEYIGKEANRWEERSQTGEDAEARIRYGAAGGSPAELRAAVRKACERYGLRALAREAGLSAHAVSDFTTGRGKSSEATLATLQATLPRLADIATAGRSRSGNATGPAVLKRQATS